MTKRRDKTVALVLRVRPDTLKRIETRRRMLSKMTGLELSRSQVVVALIRDALTNAK